MRRTRRNNSRGKWDGDVIFDGKAFPTCLQNKTKRGKRGHLVGLSFLGIRGIGATALPLWKSHSVLLRSRGANHRAQKVPNEHTGPSRPRYASGSARRSTGPLAVASSCADAEYLCARQHFGIIIHSDGERSREIQTAGSGRPRTN